MKKINSSGEKFKRCFTIAAAAGAALVAAVAVIAVRAVKKAQTAEVEDEDIFEPETAPESPAVPQPEAEEKAE